MWLEWRDEGARQVQKQPVGPDVQRLGSERLKNLGVVGPDLFEEAGRSLLEDAVWPLRYEYDDHVKIMTAELTRDPRPIQRRSSKLRILQMGVCDY